MLRRRIAYLLALVGALLFQICFTGYLASFVFVLALVFPLLSLLLSLPALFGCQITLTPTLPAVERGDSCGWVVRVKGGFGLPLARLTYRLEEDNALTGHHAALRRSLSGASSATRLTEPVDTGHCGLLTCTLSRTRVCDLLGLFAIPKGEAITAQVLVLPRPAAPEELPQLPDGGRESAGLRPRPGGGPGEDYELRPYRPGDPMRNVHWKLSSKWDDLVIRETLEERKIALVLTYDHFGPPEELDTVFDRLFTLSRQLLERERPHYICWADPVSGSVRVTLVDSSAALTACLRESFSTPSPLHGKSMLDRPVRLPGAEGPVRRLHLSAPNQTGGALS